MRYFLLYNEVIENSENFFNFTGMSNSLFQELLSIVKERSFRKKDHY